MSDETKIELLARYFEGIASEDEVKEIHQWCDESEENRRVFSEIKEIWLVSGNVHKNVEPDVNSAWRNVDNKIDRIEKTKQKNNRNLFWYLPRVAAVFVIGFVLYFMHSVNSKSDLVFVKHNSSEAKKVVKLPDGSEVTLNKNTLLEYVKNFEGGSRLVKLDGEAFFDVTKDPDKPFIIKSLKSRIKVLGTSFNYNASSSLKKNSVIVTSGKVEFSNIEGNKSVKLTKGEQGELNLIKGTLEKSLNKNKNYLSWKSDIMVFENDTLEDVIRILENYYNIKFEFVNPENKSIKLSVKFENQKLEDVLKILEFTLNLTFQKSSNKILIK